MAVGPGESTVRSWFAIAGITALGGCSTPDVPEATAPTISGVPVICPELPKGTKKHPRDQTGTLLLNPHVVGAAQPSTVGAFDIRPICHASDKVRLMLMDWGANEGEGRIHEIVVDGQPIVRARLGGPNVIHLEPTGARTILGMSAYDTSISASGDGPPHVGSCQLHPIALCGTAPEVVPKTPGDTSGTLRERIAPSCDAPFDVVVDAGLTARLTERGDCGLQAGLAPSFVHLSVAVLYRDGDREVVGGGPIRMRWDVGESAEAPAR